MSLLAKRALFAVLTVLGLLVLAVGAWFTFHLGSSGSATFTATPVSGAVVVVAPTVLNRVDRPVSVTAVAPPGTTIWMGRATPTDAQTIIGGADRTSVTAAHISDWSLLQSRSGAGAAPALATADIWRQTTSGDGRVHLTVDQSGAPESVVIAAPDGKPVDLTSLTVTVERSTWFFQALLVALVGLLATVAGAAGLWHNRPRPSRAPAGEREPATGAPTEEVSA